MRTLLLTLVALTGCDFSKHDDVADEDTGGPSDASTGAPTPSDTGDTDTLPPTNYGPQAHFTVGGTAVSYRQATGNLIRCEQSGDRLALRFAEETSREGEDGARLDIEVCHYVGAGTYAIHDPWAYPCGDGATFDIFWRETPSNGWVNRLDSDDAHTSAIRKTERYQHQLYAFTVDADALRDSHVFLGLVAVLEWPKLLDERAPPFSHDVINTYLSTSTAMQPRSALHFLVTSHCQNTE